MASIFPDTSVNNPETGFGWKDGDVWYDPDSGITYVWYNPVWKTGSIDNIGASVEVGDTAPVAPEVGDLWWKTPDNLLYVWYSDDDSDQWVIASPPLNINTDLFVETTGDDMTGNLTLGTDKITLDATTGFINCEGWANFGNGTVNNSKLHILGSAGAALQIENDAGDNTVQIQQDGSSEFAGNVDVGGSLDDQTASAARIGANGYVQARRSGTDGVWFGFTENVAAPTSQINADGSATFMGRIKVGETSTLGTDNALIIYGGGTGPNVTIAASGASQFNARLTVGISSLTDRAIVGASNVGPGGGGTISAFQYNGSGEVWNGFNINTQTSTIFADGTISGKNVTFNLEADDDTKYTSTTDSEGNETRVYNGAVLDVKDRLQKSDAALLSLKTAVANATDFAALKIAMTAALADI